MSQDYFEKLKDPRWQEIRLRVFERDKFTCRMCKSKDNTLTVHHLVYFYERAPWDYPLECFMTLCEACHEKETPRRRKAMDSLKMALSRCEATSEHIEVLAGFLNDIAEHHISKPMPWRGPFQNRPVELSDVLTVFLIQALPNSVGTLSHAIRAFLFLEGE